ncbi:unnamed protein product [Pieris macdunnoughi]|uniref:Uncharacterized protein n=1 Tax=Pieris macdunnoughi TaxID=345717 RepID=A0A821VSN0_9NEOP|nr:unnamed protein product [Pieris macdunnoughi]
MCEYLAQTRRRLLEQGVLTSPLSSDEHNALAEARRAHNLSLRRPPPQDFYEDAAGTAPKRVCALTTPPKTETQHLMPPQPQAPLSQRDPRRRRLADAPMGMTPTMAPPAPHQVAAQTEPQVTADTDLSTTAPPMGTTPTTVPPAPPQATVQSTPQDAANSYAAMTASPAVARRPPLAPLPPAASKPKYPPFVIESLPDWTVHVREMKKRLGRTVNGGFWEGLKNHPRRRGRVPCGAAPVEVGEGHHATDCPLPKGQRRSASTEGAHPANHSTCPVLKEEARNKRAGTVAHTTRGMGASKARGAHGAPGAPGAPGASGARGARGAHGAQSARDAHGAHGAHGASAPAPAKHGDEPRTQAQAEPRAHGQHVSYHRDVDIISYPAEPLRGQRRRPRGGRGRGGLKPPAPPRAEFSAQAEAGPSRAAADSAPADGATRAAGQRAARPHSGGPLGGLTPPIEAAIAAAVDRAVNELMGALYPPPSDHHAGRRGRSRGVRKQRR